jgi:hypothetical protein
MRKSVQMMIAALLFGATTFAQLSGPKSIPGDYPTVAAAIADLNAQGVGGGGVTFNVAANYTETFLSPLAGLITATGTSADQIVFQKSGVGNNPLITAGVGTSLGTGSLALDGIIVITGGDYITFDGINLTENAANLDATTKMEIGYGLLKASKTAPVNGCQNITIRNCSVTLSKYATTTNITTGIYAGNHVYTDKVNITNYTAVTDALNNCKFYNNTISTVSNGIILQGYNTTFDLYDQNNEIGVDGANTIIDFNIYGINTRYQSNLKVANSAISTTAAGITNQQIYGILVQNTNGCDTYNNTVTLQPSAGNSGLNGINVYAGEPGITANIYGNTVQNCTNAAATNAAFNGIANSGQVTTLNFYSNTVKNNSFAGTGAFTGMSSGNVANLNMYNNEVSNNTKTGNSGTFTAIVVNASLTSNVHHNLVFSNYNNTTASATQAGTMTGISSSNGNPANIYNNKIYDLTNNGGGVNFDMFGIQIGSGTVVNVYNNYIYDLKAPIASPNANPTINPTKNLIAGINNTTSPVALNVYFNTVYLNASSTGANFSTACFNNGNGPKTDLRNNLFVNVSTPAGLGIIAALRRTSTTLDNYLLLSNANAYYAGEVEDATHTVYNDGTTSYDFAAFQTLVGPVRESGSFRHTPLFMSSVAPYDLHIVDGLPTPCESGGMQINTPVAITTDYDGDTRSSAPDIGADEFNGTPISIVNPGGVTPTAVSSHQINVGFTANAADNNVVIVWNLTGSFTSPSGTPPAVGEAFAGGTLLSNGTTSPASHTGLTGAITYYYKAFSFDGTEYSLGIPAFTSTNIAPPSGFTATAFSATQINLAWTKNAFNNDVIVAINSSDYVNQPASYDQPVNGTVYVAGNLLPNGGTVIYVGPLSGFNHTGLIPNITTYYYKAWSYDPTNNNIYSPTGVMANAATLCSTATIPFTESFEYNGTIGCGTVVNVESNDYTWTINNGFSKQGSYSLRMNGGINSYGNDWYFTNGLELTAGVTYEVKFWYRNQNVNGNPHQIEVKWGNQPSVAGMTSSPIFYDIALPKTTTYTQKTCSFLTPSATGIYHVGWHDFSPVSPGSNLYMDMITIEVIPAPESPTLFTAVADLSTINLSYVLNAAGNDVIIATNSTATFDQPVNGSTYQVGNTIGSNGTVIYKGTLTAFSQTDREPNTTYFYKIWSVNGRLIYSSPGATADATTANYHHVCVSTGWSSVSSYQVPQAPAIETVLTEIEDEMQIIMGYNGFYWPAQNINLIGNWNTNQGYKIKMNEAACFHVIGEMSENKTINVPQGTSYIPVLCDQPVPSADIFSQFGNHLLFAFDLGSELIYWPDGGLYSLEVLEPGVGYLVNLHQAANATFTCGGADNSNLAKAQAATYENAPWTCAKTGVQHFIAIHHSAVADLEKGTFIGAFDAQGNCVGFTQYNGQAGNLLLVANGDDLTTDATDGLAEGEMMTFKVYNPSQMSQTEVEVSFSSSMPNAGSFAEMGLSMILKMGAGSTAIQENVLSEITLHPNPSNGIFTMEMPSIGQLISITVENSNGKLVYSEQLDHSATSSIHQLDLSKETPGVYFVRISSNNQTVVKKVVIL